MARFCAKWMPGKKKRHGGKRRKGRHCRYGVVKRGRRKGACLKHKRARRR